jgi:2-polyprenyl-3-methyl-5-hydroxy-6-metoxy-1,4-benzoquinol methylase
MGWRFLLFHHDFLVYERYRWLRGRARSHQRVLDVGSGTGAFTFFGTTIGDQVLGLTHSPSDADKAARRARLLGIRGARFETCNVNDAIRLRGFGNFDEIWCLEVVEHILDDSTLVANLASLLSGGGRLIITTPNANYIHLRGDRLSNTEDGGHVRWGYTHEQLAALMHAAGLQIVEQGYYGGYLAQKCTNVYRAVTDRVGRWPAWVAVLPLRPLVVLDDLVTRLTKYRCVSVTMVGVAPLTRPASPQSVRA